MLPKLFLCKQVSYAYTVANSGWLNDVEFRAWIGYRRMRLLLDAQVARDLQQDSGLSDADYDVLSALADAKDHSQQLTALSARMLWSKSRLSRHIGRMEARGLVVRRGHADDGRRADVVLTDHGTQVLVEAAPHHVESVRQHFIDLLTEDQLWLLGDIADTVLSQLPRLD
jgi:DNA-binding MarR family transcriptional regulator